MLSGALGAAGVGDYPEVQGAARLFDAWMKGQVEYRHLPGVVVGVVHGDELVWSRAYGGTPLEGKFRMASHSKLFTATAVMHLRDAGKLRLDDPVVKYLPWFQPASAKAGDDAEITIEELLTHASGLSREAGTHWSDLAFPDEAAVKAYVKANPVIYAPEVRWKYSNLAYTIAALVVEAVSGEKYAEYVRKNIFTPLGMTNSSFDEPVAGMVEGFARRMPDGTREKMPFVSAKAMAGATGLTSTLGDMAKFVSLQFASGVRGGKQILSTGALRQMHRVRMLENNWQRGYAIGFAVTREKDKVYVGHGGVYPGYTTHTMIQLEDRVGVIVLTNAGDSNPAQMAQQLMNTVGDAVAKAAKAAAPPAKVSWDPAWRRFVGRYRSRFGDLEVVEMNERLVILNPAMTELGEPTRLTPLGGGRFRFEGATGGATVGEVVRFAEEGGRVVRMYTGGNYADRVQ